MSLIGSIPVIILSPMIQSLLNYHLDLHFNSYIQFCLSAFIFFYGGWPFLKGLKDEIKKRQPGMMTLITLAISVAFIYSSAVVFGLKGKFFFWELVTLIDIMLLGHWIEMRSVMNASNAMQELIKILPSTATKLDENGEQISIKISEIKKGDTLLVKPGEKVPADGTLTKGDAQINESMITGESTTVAKQVQDKLIGGSINGESSFQMEVTATGEDSYLHRVVDMVKKAQESKSKAQNLAQKAAGWLFYIALGAGVITFILWRIAGSDLAFAMERMVTVMIISCPHALGLAVPLVVAISTSVSAQNGLLIRNRTAFENCRKIDTLIFDKTGTLTTGKFGVNNYRSTSELDDNKILQLLASLESQSEHPIASGILEEAKNKELELSEVSEYSNITGRGIKGHIHGEEYFAISPNYLDEMGMYMPENLSLENASTNVLLVQHDKVLGYIEIADQIRETSQSAIEKLAKMNINSIMATGDNEKVAKAVSERLNISEYHANILPEGKQELIKKLQDEGRYVAMTGDGVNDAPALAQADVGIAVGSGTDVAAETADIVLVSSDPKDILKLIRFGTATYKKIRQNLFWAVAYNVVTIPLAAGILYQQGFILDPAVGAILMSLSTIVVAINAQLLRKQF